MRTHPGPLVCQKAYGSIANLDKVQREVEMIVLLYESIARSDSARGSYYKSISGHTWGDPHQYELSVDSSIGPEKTAELICGYANHL